MKICALAPLLAALLLSIPATPPALAKPDPPPDHWVGTWSTANYTLDVAHAPNLGLNLGSADVTLRQIVHVSLGGPLVRVELSNEFGSEPLMIGAAHLALTAPGVFTDINLASANALTFGGRPAITIPPGATVVSDPAALAVPTGGNLTISLFLPAQKITFGSIHPAAFQSNFIVPGNAVSQKTVGPTPTG